MDQPHFENLTEDLKQMNIMVLEKTRKLAESKDMCLITCQRMARETDVAKRIENIDERADETYILLRSFKDSEEQTEKHLEDIKCKTKAIESGIEELKRKILLNKLNKSKQKRVSCNNREIDSATASGTETTPERDRSQSQQVVPVSKGRRNPTDQQIPDMRIVKRERLDMAKPETSRTSPKHVCFLQTQKQYGLEIIWDMYASSEKRKMAELGHFDVDAAQTVLLIDTSESMTENGAWEETCVFVNDYLTGIEEMSTMKNVTGERERVALVTFGSQNTVQQHLTHEMQSVRRAFGRLQLGGPTPMYAGLSLLDGVLRLRSYDANGIDVYPKVILITDGKPTETFLIAGPDVSSPSTDQEAKSRILPLAESLLSSEVDVFCVPVGQGREENEFLKLFVEMSDGIMVSHNDGRTVARRLFLTMQAGKEHVSGLPFFIPGSYWDQDQNMLCRDNGEEADRTAKSSIILRNKRKQEEHKARFVNEVLRDTNDPKLPRVGTRVIRGPDGDPATLFDDDGPGTVTGHSTGHGCLAVYWDKSERHKQCSYGRDNRYDVIIVDEPRKVSEDTRMAIGCAVVQGKDWIPIPSMQGLTMRGICVAYSSEHGIAKVKWDDDTNDVNSCSEFDEKVVLLRDRPTGHKAIGPPATRKVCRNKNLK